MGSSRIIQKCQICGSSQFKDILNLGYLPSVNDFQEIKNDQEEQIFFPSKLIQCQNCKLVQLSCIVDKEILFPSSYPYTSSTTRILRENFCELSQEVDGLINLDKNKLVCDIGSNDGNLLSYFMEKSKVVGITPEEIGNKAIEKGIPTIIDYFNVHTSNKVIEKFGHPDVITATNVFAHIDNPNEVMENISLLLKKDGLFIIEVHYLKSLIETNQYDTIYHEHMRYYSLECLNNLLSSHGFKIFNAKLINTHGGSIRVFASRSHNYNVSESFNQILENEQKFLYKQNNLFSYKVQVQEQKSDLLKKLIELKNNNKKVFGIGAPSRGTTLINYCGIDESLVSYICEIKGSHKIGKYLPGTSIPVLDESILFKDQPDFVLLLSWHIAKELIHNLKKKGLRSKFIIPLPKVKVID
mgnify:FL=1